MSTFAALLIVILAVAPVFIALRYGDDLIDGLSARRRRSRKRLRHKSTRALPVRADEIERLLSAESRRDKLDERIADGLQTFDRLSRTNNVAAESEIERIEQGILRRESKFVHYLDYAWLQSETLKMLGEEVRLLRQLADLPEKGLPSSRPAAVDQRPASASDKLIENLQKAVQRKSRADQDLQGIGNTLPGPGGRFDATIGDDDPA